MFHPDPSLPRPPGTGTDELEYYSTQQRRLSQQIASLKAEEFGLRISTALDDEEDDNDHQHQHQHHQHHQHQHQHHDNIAPQDTLHTRESSTSSHVNSGWTGSSAAAEKAFDPLSWSPWDAGFESSRPAAVAAPPPATMDLRHPSSSSYYHHHHHQDPRERAAAQSLISFYDSSLSTTQEHPAESNAPGESQYPSPSAFDPARSSAASESSSSSITVAPPASPAAAGPSRGRREQDDPDLKRLRNTAASARFRAKKKKREESLERAAKEKRERLAVLEDRIHQLETENQWLKDLILEKHDKIKGKGKEKDEDAHAKEDDREGDPRKDGVGT
ncbi:hypothetical protein B7463_g4845, partial [Scytalidium lignicola]